MPISCELGMNSSRNWHRMAKWKFLYLYQSGLCRTDRQQEVSKTWPLRL